jgi:hypothetical protein
VRIRCFSPSSESVAHIGTEFGQNRSLRTALWASAKFPGRHEGCASDQLYCSGDAVHPLARCCPSGLEAVQQSQPRAWLVPDQLRVDTPPPRPRRITDYRIGNLPLYGARDVRNCEYTAAVDVLSFPRIPDELFPRTTRSHKHSGSRPS